ncbi:MAG: VOC family protein, partial [Marinobacter sp.]|nr:VOC family protein [Marinobacter sp.]
MQYLHTMIRVSNLDESLHFFCDLLGLKEMNRKSSEKGRFTLVFLAAPDDEARAAEDRAP